MGEHILAIERELVAKVIAAGAQHAQFDFTIYPYLLEEGWRDRLRWTDVDPKALLMRVLAADHAIPDGNLKGVTRVLYFCRGSQGLHWLASRSIDPIAERLFQVTSNRDFDVFIVQVEVQPDTPVDGNAEVDRQIEREVRSRCELRPVVEVLPPGTLPPTGVKATRVRDVR